MPVQQFDLVWRYMTNCWSSNSNSYMYGDYFFCIAVSSVQSAGVQPVTVYEQRK
jgi:hypothetical protein